MAGLRENHSQSQNVPVSGREAWGYRRVGGSAANSAAFKGGFYTWDLGEISRACPELQKLSKQRGLQNRQGPTSAVPFWNTNTSRREHPDCILETPASDLTGLLPPRLRWTANTCFSPGVVQTDASVCRGRNNQWIEKSPFNSSYLAHSFCSNSQPLFPGDM